jgi:hypothetical protein
MSPIATSFSRIHKPDPEFGWKIGWRQKPTVAWQDKSLTGAWWFGRGITGLLGCFNEGAAGAAHATVKDFKGLTASPLRQLARACDG